jgi:excisionase family DNA binding protein
MPVAEKTRLVPLPEAADRLGVTVATLRAWIYRRSISYTKIGRSVRLSEATIESIIERGARPALLER